MSAAVDVLVIHHELRPCDPPKQIAYDKRCTAVPEASRESIKRLAESIAKNDLLEDIVLYQGKILDGRSRQQACELDVCRSAGVVPRYSEYIGNAPAAYVASRNLERRDLTKNQKAAAAAKLLPMLEKEAAARQKSGVSAHGREGPAGEKGKAAEHAAKAAGVGTRTVERAKRVQEKGAPELVEAMEDGRVSIRAAEDLTRLPREEQLRALGMSETEIGVMVGALRRRNSLKSGNSSESEEWYSPEDIVEAAREVMGGEIALDPASCKEANEVIRAAKIFTAAQNGLTRDWRDGWFLNNPYGTFRDDEGKKRSNLKYWTNKALSELARGHRGIHLVNNNSGEEWFRPLLEMPRCSPRRVHFRAPRDVEQALGKKPDSPRHSNVVVCYGYDPLHFKRVFEERGIGPVDIPVIHVADVLVADLQRLMRDGELHEWSRRLGELYVNQARPRYARAKRRAS